MPRIDPRAPIGEPAPELRRGYVLSEDAEYKLRTIADALRGIASLTEGDTRRDLPEMPAGELAAIFRALGEATDNIRNSAAFALADVPVKPRELH